MSAPIDLEKNAEKSKLSRAVGKSISVSNRLSEYAAHDPCRATNIIVMPRAVWNSWREQLAGVQARPKLPQAFFDAVMALCRIEGECWIWKRLKCDTDQPALMWEGKNFKVRRELMRHYGIEDDIANRNCMVLTTCGSPRCVNPVHLKTMPMSAYVTSTNRARAQKISESLRRFHDARRQKELDNT